MEHDVAEPLLAGHEAGHRPARRERRAVLEAVGELVAEAERIGERHAHVRRASTVATPRRLDVLGR